MRRRTARDSTSPRCGRARAAGGYFGPRIPIRKRSWHRRIVQRVALHARVQRDARTRGILDCPLFHESRTHLSGERLERSGQSVPMPSSTSLFVAAFCWFWLAESIESAHGPAAPFSIVAALLATSALLRLLVRSSLRTLAKIVFEVYSGDFRDHSFDSIVAVGELLVLKPAVHLLRLFSRPPPNQQPA